MAKRPRSSGRNAECGYVTGGPFQDLNPTNFCLKVRSEAEAIALCEQMGLLPTQAGPHGVCVCGYPQLSTTCDVKQKLGWRYYCCGCKTKFSAIKNTWFQDSNMNIHTHLKMILCFVSGCSLSQVIKFCGVASEAAVQWLVYMREVMEVIMCNVQDKLGGPGKIVELDESVLVHRKCHRGRRLAMANKQIWIFGGIERSVKQPEEEKKDKKTENKRKTAEKGKAFMVRVHNRTMKTLDPLVEKFIAEGTHLVTDQAQVYLNMADRLPHMKLTHNSVNHSKGEFVSFIDPQVHTQTIENAWMHLKRTIRSYGKSKVLDLYIAQHLYKRMHFAADDHDDGPNFKLFLADIARVYPGLGRQGLTLLETLPNKDELLNESELNADPGADSDDSDTIIMSSGGDDPVSDVSDEWSGADSSSDDDSKAIPPLQQQMSRLINRMLPNRLPANTIVCNVGRYALAAGSLRTVLNTSQGQDKWLDDQIVNAYGAMICGQHNAAWLDNYVFTAAANRNVHVTAAVDNRMSDAYRVAGGTSVMANVFSKSLAFMPVCVGGHWTLVAIDNQKKHMK